MDERSTNFRRFIDDPTFRQYVRGTDPDAVQHWTAWLARHPEQTPAVDEATRLVRQLDQLPRHALTDAQITGEVARLRTRINGTEPTAPGRPRPVAETRRAGRLLPWLTAASVMLILGVWHYTYQPDTPAIAGKQSAQAANPQVRRAATAPQPARAVQTPYGKRQSLSLPDGSVVTLNANSSLQITRWSATQREVRLRGEAFFRVSRRTVAGQPVKFVVRASNVAVEVLGTQFDVSTRNRRVKIALGEGRIRLKILDAKRPGAEPVRSLDMLPGDLVDLANGQSLTLSSRVATADYSAWTANELVFDETPLADVARLIEENYGCIVQFADPSLANRRLTARLPDPNLDMLLNALTKAFSLTITKQEKTIIISETK